MTKPKLSIGLPVYNGEASVGSAIESLLKQSISDFELIISDNASTDQTSAIIEAIASKDSRIHYIRHYTNQGAIANFKYVLNHACADYFMWAAADDAWDPEFIEANLAHLDQNPEYVASISMVRMGELDPDKINTQGTFSLDGNFDTNLLTYVLHPGANSRFYAIHRTQALLKAWRDDAFWGSDWALVCRALESGKYHQVPRVLMWRGHDGASRNMYRSIRAWGLSRCNTWLPMWAYSRRVLHYPIIRRSPRALIWLAWLNVNTARKMLLGWLRELLVIR